LSMDYGLSYKQQAEPWTKIVMSMAELADSTLSLK